MGLNSITSSCIDGSSVTELLSYVFPFNVANTENDSMVLWLDLLTVISQRLGSHNVF